MKKKPRGFFATCQCGVVIGAMDYAKTDRKDAGKLLGAWLHDGCTVTPFFEDPFSMQIYSCSCSKLPGSS